VPSAHVFHGGWKQYSLSRATPSFAPPSAPKARPQNATRLVPELDVSDLKASLRFWCGVLGFEVAYDRPAARFAYLVRGRIQIMLCERNGNWEVGELSPPFGRGVNFQMKGWRTDPNPRGPGTSEMAAFP